MSGKRFNLLRLSGTGLTVTIAGVLMLGAATTPAFAYLDAGAGSMLLQGILATAAGSVFALKQYGRRIVARFTRKPPSDRAEDIQR
jgi:hypothetical protein